MRDGGFVVFEKNINLLIIDFYWVIMKFDIEEDKMKSWV